MSRNVFIGLMCAVIWIVCGIISVPLYAIHEGEITIGTAIFMVLFGPIGLIINVICIIHQTGFFDMKLMEFKK